MKSFRQFMTNEVLAIQQDLTTISANGNGYQSKFEDAGQEYTVDFIPTEMMVPRLPSNVCFKIVLVGPNGTEVTNLNNAFSVYRKMLSAIMNFITKINPYGLIFTGARQNMDLVYDKFYKRYLKNHYVRINSENYLRIDIANQKGFNQERLAAADATHQQWLDKVRLQKNQKIDPLFDLHGLADQWG